MNLRAALLAAATVGACVTVAACGGGDTSSNTGGSGNSGSTGSSGSIGNTGSTGSSDNTGTCPPQTATTVVGGDLFIAEQGLIGATLLSNGGLTRFDILLGYSTCESNCSAPQRQDAFELAFSLTFSPRPWLFDESTPVGITLALEPQSGIRVNGQMVSTFPTGTPIFLALSGWDERSATAYSKDLGNIYPRTALVTYGANSTAVIEFRTSAGAHICVGLTNVRGSSGGG